MSDINYQTEILSNRVLKRYKHLKKWAKRENIFSYRLYDKDIPEIPLAIDFYEGFSLTDKTSFTEKYLVFYLYERPYEKDEKEETIWLQNVSCSVAQILNIDLSNVFLKTRKKQKGNNQYEKTDNRSVSLKVNEQGNFFIVNLSDYLDTGLFFDHRPLRKIVREISKDKDVLNLYCYTGSFSVYAANGNAKSITSVDLSNTYLSWAKKNFLVNGIEEKPQYIFENSDVLSFIQNTKNTYDIIILDPPTYSNSKKTETDLDINRDWQKLVLACISILNKNGILYFSTNSRRLVFDYEILPNDVVAKEITEQTIPEDFRNKKIHKCYQIQKN